MICSRVSVSATQSAANVWVRSWLAGTGGWVHILLHGAMLLHSCRRRALAPALPAPPSAVLFQLATLAAPSSPPPPTGGTQALTEGLGEFERCAAALGGWRHVCTYRTGRRLVEARRAAPEPWRLKPSRHGYELIQVSSRLPTKHEQPPCAAWRMRERMCEPPRERDWHGKRRLWGVWRQ